MIEFSDGGRAKNPLRTSVVPTFFLSALYLIIIKIVGPAWMKNRKPYNLRHVMVVYNLFLVWLNGYICINTANDGWFTTYSWICQPIDHSDNVNTRKMSELGFLFYISKLIEYFDTVIFVLRKKDSQVNFLHVYHHSTVPISVWLGGRYGPGGYNGFFPLVNSFVHVWMYLYYGLAALGPRMRKYLWWKTHLTSLQIVQFILVFLYFTHLALFAPKSCNVSLFLVSISLVQAVIFFILFVHFYLSTYKKSSRLPKLLNGNYIKNKEQ